jgi:uncharacterized phage protein (TIGR02218 family)
MTYSDQEISTQDGRPLALYALRWDKTYWFYTSADRDMTGQELVNGVMTDVTYVARPVQDSGMVQGSGQQNDFTVDIPADLPIVDLYRTMPPSGTVWLTVRRRHYGDADAPIHWMGTVTNVKRANLAEAQIIAAPLMSSFKRTGLRLCWTRECPHFLYDVDCKVDPADFENDGVIAAKTGASVTLTMAEIPEDQYYRGGFIAWEANADGTMERRMIESQVGTNFVIFGLTDRMEVGVAVKLYPGCDRSPGTCKDKFDNIDNYGGFDFMPGESPFGVNLF